MSKSRKNINGHALLVSSLAVLLVTSTASAEEFDRHIGTRQINYGDGIKMIEYADGSGFLITTANGPSFHFYSHTQQVVVTAVNGATKVVSFDNQCSHQLVPNMVLKRARVKGPAFYISGTHPAPRTTHVTNNTQVQF